MRAWAAVDRESVRRSHTAGHHEAKARIPIPEHLCLDDRESTDHFGLRLGHETYAGLSHTTPMICAVPVALALLQTLQLAVNANRMSPRHARLIAGSAARNS